MTLPKVGYLLYFAATIWGKLLMIGVPLLILMTQEVRGLLRARKPRDHAPGHTGLDKDGLHGAPTLT